MPLFAPLLVMLTVAILLPAVIWTLGRLLRPHRPNPVKTASYECGLVSVGDAREKLSVRYYLVAVMFLVFDVETVFLMPWAIQARELAFFGLIEIGMFMFLLLFGYGYIWSKGALDWE